MKNNIKIEQIKQINPGIGGSTKMNPVGNGADSEIDGNEESIDSPVKLKKLKIQAYTNSFKEIPKEN
jgi:hypothetical protein